MSPKEKIAKLEGLLARVKERAEAPRPRGAAAFPVQPAHAAEVAHAEPVPEAAAALASPPTAPPPASRAQTQPPASARPELSSGWTEPPSLNAADPVLETSEEETDDDFDADVEVSAEVVEIDIDEPGLPFAESSAQLVADVGTTHAPERAAELEEVHDDATVTVTVEATEEEVPEELLATASVPPAAEPTPPPANELVEPAPSSSPRPIASEQPEAYEADSAPRHTPPPESGKQVAAPSVNPEPARSSVPPALLEGHTLIGGWREPGAAFGKVGGPAVRVPPPPPPPPPPGPVAAAPPAASAPAATPAAGPVGPARLEPQVTKPDLPNARVATFTGAVPTFAPATFGELLDATLAL